MFTPDANHRRLTLESFEHHVPNDEQISRIELNRTTFKATADVVLRTTAPGRDQRHALRLLHEAMMTANKAIALEESHLVEARVGIGAMYVAGDRNLQQDRNPGV